MSLLYTKKNEVNISRNKLRLRKV